MGLNRISQRVVDQVPTGDITDVVAGAGLAGGGSTGAVTLTVDTDALGDLIVGTGADTATKLTAGTNTYVQLNHLHEYTITVVQLKCACRYHPHAMSESTQKPIPSSGTFFIHFVSVALDFILFRFFWLSPR